MYINNNSFFTEYRVTRKPSTPTPTGTYAVQPGDTLYSIALRLGVSFSDLLDANVGVDNVDVIYVGQELVIP
ncbi:LysM peptidoglycan-binding domain-containing protein [Geosporobacter ferrireducens]|uniref:LysM peptidoglycan-binding domain-containing protein n=1 Tax=Geosporobacter ferrireducens TaxID=1424294 RepID=UPI002354C6A1|nr:LysM domain-containing protein [Geosporobacter ferrireducens]